MIGWLFRAAMLVAALGTASFASRPAGLPPRSADADDPALVALGRHVYMTRCASCHGRSLQGQPLWQLDDDDRSRRAPALDLTGHSWLRPDTALFRIVAGGAGAADDMPAYASLLSEREIAAVIAFVKARWPIGLRVAQAALNPGAAGTPAGSRDPAWRFPATCVTPSADRGAAR